MLDGGVDRVAWVVGLLCVVVAGLEVERESDASSAVTLSWLRGEDGCRVGDGVASFLSTAACVS